MGRNSNLIVVYKSGIKKIAEIIAFYSRGPLYGWISDKAEIETNCFCIERSVKYYFDEKTSSICIFDNSNSDIEKESIEISKNTDSKVLQIQVFDSDILVVRCFKNGVEEAILKKEYEKFIFEGGFSFIGISNDDIRAILLREYVVVEELLVNIFGSNIVYPEKRISKQKIIKYKKLLNIPIIYDAPTKFLTSSYNSVIFSKYNLPSFNFSVINIGRSSQGVIIAISGSAINMNNIEILSVSVKDNDNNLVINEFEVKIDGNNKYIIFKDEKKNILPSYDCSAFQQYLANIDAYKSFLEYRYKSNISFNIFYRILNNNGEITVTVGALADFENSATTQTITIQ